MLHFFTYYYTPSHWHSGSGVLQLDLFPRLSPNQIPPFPFFSTLSLLFSSKPLSCDLCVRFHCADQFILCIRQVFDLDKLCEVDESLCLSSHIQEVKKAFDSDCSRKKKKECLLN